MLYFRLFSEIPIVSENFLYKPRIGRAGGGRTYAYLYKDPQVEEFQNKIRVDFNKLVDKDLLPEKELVQSIVTYYTFGLHPDRLMNRDLTNCIKAVEDVLLSKNDKSVFPYDDSQVTCNLQRKVPSDNDFVFVVVGLITSYEEFDLDQIIRLAQSSNDSDIVEYLRRGTSGFSQNDY